MNHPKIDNAKAIDGKTLIIEFDNQQIKKYDITPPDEKRNVSSTQNSCFI